MRVDLQELLSIARGEIFPQSGVTGVAGVAAVARYASKSPELRQLRPLRVKSGELEKDAFRGVIEGVATPPDFPAAKIERRETWGADGAPEHYRDAWTRLRLQKPLNVGAAEWRRALDDAAAFFLQWGALAVEWQWPAGALFDVPNGDGGGGLVWFIAGATVEAFGPEHARLDDGRIFDRLQMRREGGA